MKDTIALEFSKALANFNAMATDPALAEQIERAVELCTTALRSGNRILFAGNGGSAADAQHWAGELVSRFYYDRPGLAAIALTTDSSILTAISNDYGYDYVFARQVEALGQAGDVLVAISTSGNSKNILRAVDAARTRGLAVIGFTGRTGGQLAGACELCFRVPSDETPRIQEGHEFVGHLVCSLIEARMYPREGGEAAGEAGAPSSPATGQPDDGSRDTAYLAKMQQEQERYRDVLDVNALPPIFHYWAHTHLRPMFEEFGVNHPDDWFVRHLLEGARRTGAGRPAFVSIGAGNCDTEVRVAKLLREAGLQDFVIECVDINQAMLDRGRQMAEEHGVAGNLEFLESDFNYWRANRAYDAIMANQSLHHVVNLEGLFDEVRRALHPQGIFVVSDIIGRNGHQRWPEALEALHRFWQELPQGYRYNHLLRRHEESYDNWDCSAEGFEGIRAQDILPLLLERFQFYRSIAFGNVIDPLIDRGFGHNFDADAPWDRDFIDRVHAFDEQSFRDGTLKPTHLFAAMTVGEPPAREYSRGLAPESCVRLPG